MKLFLTSGGLKIPYIRDEFLKILPKPANEIKLAHIITASKVAEDTNFVDKEKKAMEELGLQVTDIDIAGKTENELAKILKNQDVIYVQGGNAFYLLKHIKLSGFDKVVKKLLKQGKIYVGVSAGSCVACPSIEMYDWQSEKEKYGVTDLTAMKLVPYLITVHYNRVKYRNGLKESIKQTKYPVKILTDYQAILVSEDKEELVGVGSEIKTEDLLKDKQPTKHEINMELAIHEAKSSQKAGGTPIGAVMVKNEKIIATGGGLVWPKKDPSAHAEMECIRSACQKLQSLDLSGCTLYSTIETCSMCLGCAGWTDLSKIIFGAYKEDASENPYEISDYHAETHAKKLTPIGGNKIEVKGGILRKECKKLMENFKNWSPVE